MFFGMPNKIIGAKGQAIHGAIGFIGALNRLADMYHPTHLVVMFDGETCNPRKEILEDYKANRPDWSEMPEDEIPFTQLPIIYEALDYMGIKHAETTVCETDDVIAAYALKYGDKSEVIISSFDSDYFQLINKNVRIVRYRGQSTVLCDEYYINDKYGIAPSKYLEYKCLVGDSSDNIKGVRGIGPKTAAKLLNAYGDIRNLFEHLDEIPNEKLRCALDESRELIERNMTLIKLSDVADIPFSLEQAKFDNPRLRTMDVIRGIGH